MANRTYSTVLYVDNNSKKRNMRLSADDVTAQVVAPGTGSPDVPESVKISGSRRGFGVHPRGLRLSRPASATAGSKILYDFIVICDAASWTSKTKGSTITIGANTWTVTSQVPEVIR